MITLRIYTIDSRKILVFTNDLVGNLITILEKIIEDFNNEIKPFAEK